VLPPCLQPRLLVTPRRRAAGESALHLAIVDWFDFLQVGDQVQVVKASAERAAREAANQAGGEPADSSDSGDE
jgi:hypothetical protein